MAYFRTFSEVRNRSLTAEKVRLFLWKHIYYENVCQVVTSDLITQIEYD